jgi:hypothetical protein
MVIVWSLAHNPSVKLAVAISSVFNIQYVLFHKGKYSALVPAGSERCVSGLDTRIRMDPDPTHHSAIVYNTIS